LLQLLLMTVMVITVMVGDHCDGWWSLWWWWLWCFVCSLMSCWIGWGRWLMSVGVTTDQAIEMVTIQPGLLFDTQVRQALSHEVEADAGQPINHHVLKSAATIGSNHVHQAVDNIRTHSGHKAPGVSTGLRGQSVWWLVLSVGGWLMSQLWPHA